MGPGSRLREGRRNRADVVRQEGKNETMNIYVGNLSYDATDNDLQTAFSAYGNVRTAQVVKDRETGRSRGFGFVEMDSQAEAELAIRGLNGTDLRGRSLTVNQAKPPAERGERRSGGGGYGGGGGGGYGGGGGRRY
ncbi:MAG: hypothetical protein AMXMBFR80_03560 [Dehalococcoidia bacterium]